MRESFVSTIDIRGQESFVIVESELDGLLIDQDAGDLTGVVSLGNAQSKPDQETDRVLRQSRLILIALDFDEAGAKASWKYWLSTYSNAFRWPVPIGKDPGEAFHKGLNIRAWIQAGFPEEASCLQGIDVSRDTIKPFPKEWIHRFDETQLERLAITTMDGCLSDREAERLLN